MAGLTVGQPAGAQAATQNPQSIPTQSIGASAQSGGVQPGTASSLLSSGNGSALHGTALTTVSFGSTIAGTQTSNKTSNSAPASHHVNALVFIIPALFCVIAIGLFWQMTRSAKSTTD